MACRETHCLFKWTGIKVVFRDILNNGRPCWGWKVMLEDTFMPIVCYIFGHKEYFPPDETELACLRCHKYIKAND